MSKNLDLEKALKGIDFTSIKKAVAWSLNAPTCSDGLCFKFKSWTDWGSRLVKENAISLEDYTERVKEETSRRRERKISREIYMEKMEARLTAAFGCGA